MGMRDLYERWTSVNLVIRIVAGLAIGAVLALVLPGIPFLSTLGSMFVGALKAIAPILVMLLVISSLSRPVVGQGRRFRMVLLLYIGSTVVATIVATVFSYAFPVTVDLDVPPGGEYDGEGIVDLVSGLLVGMVSNPVKALIEGNYLCILFWAALVGLVMRSVANETTVEVMTNVSDVVVKAVCVIIEFAPIGILGLVYETVSTNGLDVFADYGMLIVLLVACMAVVMFVTNPLISAAVMRRNPYPLLYECLRTSAVTAFFTRSSAANIPVNLDLCRRLGLNMDFCSVSIPLGATINMNGAAITITVMTMCAAFSLGMEIPIMMAAPLCIIAAVAACGASGVAGGSLLLIPMACSFLGIDGDVAMQMVAIGFIIGVIQDSMETALNSSADVFFSATVDARVGTEEARRDVIRP